MARLTGTGILFDLVDPNNKIDSFYWMYPAGTKKFFYQAAAPTGWSQDTSMGGDKALRVVNGNGGGQGGTTAFSSVLSSSSGNVTVGISTQMVVNVVPGQGTMIGNHTLALSQLPEHSHPSGLGPTGGSGATPFSNTGARTVSGSTSTGTMVPAGGGGSHGHPFSGTSQITTTFSDGVNMAVNYVDVIICTLN
tara:strand:+ start:1217 stop:1795 length:579 start_codon:yes stop_codon:yes gene_type:complete